MEFSRQEYWSGLPFPSLMDLPDPVIEPSLLYCRQILYCLSHQSLYRKMKFGLGRHRDDHLCDSCEWQGCSKRTLDCCCELLAATFSGFSCLTVLLILWDMPGKANQGPVLQPATEQKEPSLIHLRTSETSMIFVLEKKRLKTCENWRLVFECLAMNKLDKTCSMRPQRARVTSRDSLLIANATHSYTAT